MAWLHRPSRGRENSRGLLRNPITKAYMSDRTKRRLKLFNENPHCLFCQEVTTIQEVGHSKSPPKNFAVLFGIIGADGMPQTVLACRECATKKNEEKMAQLGLDELRVRSSPQGKCLCPNCGNTHFRSLKSSS